MYPEVGNVFFFLCYLTDNMAEGMSEQVYRSVFHLPLSGFLVYRCSYSGHGKGKISVRVFGLLTVGQWCIC